MISVNVDITLMARFILQNKVLKFLKIIKNIVSVIKTRFTTKMHSESLFGTKNTLWDETWDKKSR